VSAIARRFSIFLILISLLAETAWGQSRVAQSTPLPDQAMSSGGTRAASPTVIYGQPTGGATSPGLLPVPGMSGGTTSPSTTYAPSTANPYSAQPGTATATMPASPASQPYVPPGNAVTQPTTVSPFVPTATAPPAGSYGGTVVPVSPGMDPYAYSTPGNTPSPLLADDPYFQYGSAGIPMAAMTKFCQDIRLDYHWFLGHGQKELGLNDIDLSATFAIPFLSNPNTPLLITPGFDMQLWEGPISIAPATPTDPAAADLPDKTYGAYIDTAWKPQIANSPVSGDLSVRVGLYSDFTTTTTKSIRVTGNAFGVVQLSRSVKLKAGVMYLNRLEIKLLPSGGIIWTPNSEIEFQILFPNPKIRKHLTTTGTVDWWIYASGDYGGGSWTIKRANIPGVSDPEIAGQNDAFDYDDIRIAAGVEFLTQRRMNGWFEAGGAFSRKLHYRSGLPENFYPNNAFFLRAGLAF
jgi:hypothetical protein